ncbi:MAG: type 1 glutamine amidotransferase [Parvibaculum sp.]|nr:type 1 glutamine amidotransferase [Parvibaculum sp.]
MHILYLVNEPNSGPGVLLEEATRLGASHEIVATYEGGEVPSSHADYDGLVVMGGIMGVYEDAAHPFIEHTRALIRAFHHADKPVMGVCLGAQMLASAFGGRVYKMGYDEWGFLAQTWEPAAKDDPLLHDAPEALRILHWHGDTFELPDGAVRLSTRETCPNQAFRVGAKSYGFQFHLEVTKATLDHWIDWRARDKSAAAADVRALSNVEALAEAQVFARDVMARWMEL